MLAEDVSTPAAQVQITSVELAGQLSGDLAELLGRLTKQVGDSRVIRISCALLMRVDFVAAGDLLNWVAQRHAEGREIVFHETHRLVALMSAPWASTRPHGCSCDTSDLLSVLTLLEKAP